MREVFKSEQNEIAGGEDLLPVSPPSQSQEEIGSLLDQVKHLNGRPGTY